MQLFFPLQAKPIRIIGVCNMDKEKEIKLFLLCTFVSSWILLYVLIFFFWACIRIINLDSIQLSCLTFVIYFIKPGLESSSFSVFFSLSPSFHVTRPCINILSPLLSVSLIFPIVSSLELS